MDARAWVGRKLESGTATSAWADPLARAWGAMVRLERPLHWRVGASVVVVGGSTLGGSGKTPLAIACAEDLHASGVKVALVGHGYRASPGRARVVSPEDDVRIVGDEALICARHFSPLGVPVTVAKGRQDALDLALEHADVAVVDGPCQTKPRRATLALLAVDALEPWGSGRCPPRGDLRAPRSQLLSVADRVVVTGDVHAPRPLALPELEALPVDHAETVSRGAWLAGLLLEWESLRRLKVGLWTATARPHRILHALRSRGVMPEVIVSRADHARGDASRPTPASSLCLDLWLASAKCRTHLPSVLEGVPVATLDHSVRLSSGLRSCLRRMMSA
jgi:tetraacyldisaccharide 4'-kinase